MKKTVIIPLSLYMDNQQQRSIDAFAKLGISKLAILWHWIPLPSFLERFRGPRLPALFDRYRSGKLTTIQFRNAIREKFPNTSISDAAFDKAWNAMCQVTNKTKQALDEVKILSQKGIKVYLLSGTNPLHIEHIKHKYGKELPGHHFFSYQDKKLGHDLFTSLLRKIRTENPRILRNDIAFFYTPPGPAPYSYLGIFAWLLAPFKKWFHSQAQKYVAKLQSESTTSKGFKLIPYLFNKTKPNIVKKIAKLGWIDRSKISQKRDHSSSFLPMHSMKRTKAPKSMTTKVVPKVGAKLKRTPR